MARAGSVTRRSSAETREHVLEVAHDLFYWQGIRAVGVDRIAAEAGVAPTTLYRLWSSKDDLVAAYVERADRGYREWFDAATAHGSPRERILSLFDALAVQTQPDRCRGCPFQMALTEFPDPEVAAHRNAATNKAWVRARLGELTAGMPGSEALADQLAVLMEGVYASAQALGAEGPARSARALAEALLPPES
ncbi:TetR family transcriptional regulator [Pseudonocardia hierapolitana]|uniref:TetR family transcriptional regulator n=1 Tax=Pseudonocardia hierapolitana TaxID=1128676 RepID=A0A561SZ23_9PSEU|nr:TetR/AcrR family transcriptional regulator [Pseudonocardia hierapolitana]TWF80092.1 TetR family transcriptional regulator [Pseudonocardia hierapolitana]